MWDNDFEDLIVVSFIILIILSFCSYRYYYYPVIHTPVAMTTMYEEPIPPVVQPVVPVVPVVPIIQPIPVYQPVYHSFYRPRRYHNYSTVNVSVNNCNTSCKPVNTCAPVTAYTTHTTTRSWNPFRRSTITHTTVNTSTPIRSYCAPKPNYSSCKTTYKTTCNKPVKICAPLRAYKHSCSSRRR